MANLPGLADIWRERPDLIRVFLSERHLYEQLAAEVAYILKTRLAANGIEIAAVTHRAKDLESFVEKISRKSYKEPLREITDRGGVRVVHLYAGDQSQILAAIEREFVVVEHVDKQLDKGPDQFGYNAVHLLVRLGKRSSGARYDDLKHLICEIQVRTILQDAWAIIDHHLAYKKSELIPHTLRRKLNSLAGMLETADDQFNRIRSERNDYLERVTDKESDPETFLNQELNQDTLTAYLKARDPSEDPLDGYVSGILRSIDTSRFHTLRSLDELMTHTAKPRSRYFSIRKFPNPKFAQELWVALAMESQASREGFTPEAIQQMEEALASSA
jgi:putative GTP pyrophosphokinase